MRTNWVKITAFREWEKELLGSALDVEICYYVVTILSAICSSLGDNIVRTRWIKEVIDAVPRFLRFVVIEGFGET